ncbi:MAG: hypothetical protein IIW93_09875, partial [Bacteroidaceae bacterium]|nr:hypothetical protein [Bacteroidaceae bacterium]
TGQMLQTILDNMVASLGAKYQYAGVATPATNPGTPDQNVFYLAATAGTYTNFGGLVVAEGEVAALKYNGAWAKDTTGAATADQVSQLGKIVNNSLAQTTILQAVSTLGGYPRTNGSFYQNQNYVSNVYDVSQLEKVYISGNCAGVENVALIAFSSDATFASYTHGFIRQPSDVQEINNFEVKVPAHTGTLYACLVKTTGSYDMFDLSVLESYIDAVGKISEINGELDGINDELDGINDVLTYKKEIQGTTISGYPRRNGTISGNVYRSKVYDVSNFEKIYITGTINLPSLILLVAFSTDPNFATFTSTVLQPSDVDTISDYPVDVPQHNGALYACIPFATTAAEAELGGNIFTLVKSGMRFVAQIFNDRLNVDENRISELENELENLSKVTINCIGDSITQGQGGILNLRAGTTSTWNRYESYLQQILGQEKYSVKNYGYGGNDPSSIFTSMGWEGVVINQNITLKGDKTPVAINDINALTGTSLDEVVGGYLAQFRTTEAEIAQTKCAVFGIPCNLSRSNNVLYLARQEEASYDTTVPAGTMLCFDGVLDKDGISVLFTGENNMTLYTQNNGADFVEYLRNIVSKISNGKYIIIGLHVAANQLSDIDSIKTANNALRKEFGNRFIDLQKELSSYAIFQQLDYVPTDDSYFTSQQLAGGVYSDEGAIALGIQPSSFWRQVKGIAGYTANDSIHMSGLGYNALAILISNRFKTLGWVTE